MEMIYRALKNVGIFVSDEMEVEIYEIKGRFLMEINNQEVIEINN